MAPFIISGISSLASTLLDTSNQANTAQPLAPSQPGLDFDSLLKSCVAGALGLQPLQAGNATGPLMQQILQAPEVAGALNGQNLPPGSQLDFGADGNLALKLPGGYTQPLALSAQTRMLVAGLRNSMTGAPGTAAPFAIEPAFSR
jgi:hypothetical protein